MSEQIIYWTWSKPGESLCKSAKIVKEEIPEKKDENIKDQFVEQNKRELNYDKIASRQLMTSGNINPFHIKNNYADDISVQDSFLRPKDSNQE